MKVDQTKRKRNGKIEQSSRHLFMDTASLFSSALRLDPFSAVAVAPPLETGVEEVFVLADFSNPSNSLASGELGAKCKRSTH